MEGATAATSSTVNIHDDEDDDVRTMAEPEMEVDNHMIGDEVDVLGKWPTLCDIGPVTKVSRDVTDQEMHASCYAILQSLIAAVTGKTMFAMLREPPTGSHDYLYIDPVAVTMITGIAATTTTTIELLVNYDIVIPAKYTAKLNRENLVRLRIVPIPASVTKAKGEAKLLIITSVTANVIEATPLLSQMGKAPSQMILILYVNYTPHSVTPSAHFCTVMIFSDMLFLAYAFRGLS
ncbi:unnamed protein product [Symbiodinium microadriaticum]|nr:unnamed protein product [Symbiodinium microadriaticum]